MVKWADYLISDKKYTNIDGIRYIDEVEIHIDNDNIGSQGCWWPREKVISLIRIGNTFCMINKVNKWWKPGAHVNIFNIKGNSYLKTVADDKEKDDLEDIF